MAKIHLVTVVAESTWPAICKVCRQQVVWAKTAHETRWVLFNQTVEGIAAETDRRNGTWVKYYPTSAMHWKSCRTVDAAVEGGGDARGDDTYGTLRPQRPENAGDDSIPG